MANGTGSKLAPLWLVVGGVAIVIAGMATLVAIHPLDFSPPKAAVCEGESCAGHDSAPGEHPAVPAGAHEAAPEHEAAPAGEHAVAPPAEHHE